MGIAQSEKIAVVVNSPYREDLPTDQPQLGVQFASGLHRAGIGPLTSDLSGKRLDTYEHEGEREHCTGDPLHGHSSLQISLVFSIRSEWALLERRCLRSIYNPVELGTNIENGNSHVWLQSVLWFLEFVPGGEKGVPRSLFRNGYPITLTSEVGPAGAIGNVISIPI